MQITKKEYEVLQKFDSLLKDKFKLNKITYKWDAEKLRLSNCLLEFSEDIPTDVDTYETYGYEIIEK